MCLFGGSIRVDPQRSREATLVYRLASSLASQSIASCLVPKVAIFMPENLLTALTSKPTVLPPSRQRRMP